MRFALCDDDPASGKEISSLLFEYASLHPELEITVFSFSDGKTLMEDVLKNGEYDFYFLDVVMPKINGINLGKGLRNSNCQNPIIYLTSSEEYAIDSYRVRALDYLLKPVDKALLFSTLDEALEKYLRKKNDFIVVKTKLGNLKVNLSQILYVQLSNRFLFYYLNDGSMIKSLYLRVGFTEAIAPLLEKSNFFLCGAGIAVNLHFISKLENDSILFCDKFSVSLGTKSFRILKSRWVDYCINEEDF